MYIHIYQRFFFKLAIIVNTLENWVWSKGVGWEGVGTGICVGEGLESRRVGLEF